MTITAALVWYDEEPKDLAACVAGVATVADRIVAVDGAYRRYPDAHISSPPEQAAIIHDAAAKAGIEAVVYTPNRLWAGQLEKRTFLMQKASIDTDWIAVVDTDWIIRADRDSVHRELAEYGPDIDVVSVPFYTTPGDRYATGWHRKQVDVREPMAHLFRPLPGFLVEVHHWWYSAMKGNERVWMWYSDGGQARRSLPHYQIRSFYEIEHQTTARDEKHILAGRAFCNDRVMVFDRTGQEDDVPGLPEPVWDYVTEPY